MYSMVYILNYCKCSFEVQCFSLIPAHISTTKSLNCLYISQCGGYIYIISLAS